MRQGAWNVLFGLAKHRREEAPYLFSCDTVAVFNESLNIISNKNDTYARSSNKMLDIYCSLQKTELGNDLKFTYINLNLLPNCSSFKIYAKPWVIPV